VQVGNHAYFIKHLSFIQTKLDIAAVTYLFHSPMASPWPIYFSCWSSCLQTNLNQSTVVGLVASSSLLFLSHWFLRSASAVQISVTLLTNPTSQPEHSSTLPPTYANGQSELAFIFQDKCISDDLLWHINALTWSKLYLDVSPLHTWSEDVKGKQLCLQIISCFIYLFILTFIKM